MRTLNELNSIWYTTKDIHYDFNFFKSLIPCISKFLVDNNKESGKLLDLGCGFGEKANVFKKIGFEVTGIDNDVHRVNKAKSDFPEIDFFNYNIIKKLPFEDNTFDLIFSCSVFQYIDHEAIINECKRIIKPDGCIILIENLKNNPITKAGRTYLKLTKFNYQSYPYNHFTFKEITELKNKFKKSQNYFFHFLTPLSHFKIVKNLFSQLENIDNILFKLNIVKRFSWITFFAGVNSK